MTFFSKTVAESKDAAPGKRQEIYEGMLVAGKIVFRD
jgi:hypothetical protein